MIGVLCIGRDKRAFIGDGGHRMAMFLRLTSGIHVLESWTTTASQADVNAVYRALFAVADGSVFHAYDIAEEFARPERFSILVKEDLVIRILLGRTDSFAIQYIGSRRGSGMLDTDWAA